MKVSLFVNHLRISKGTKRARRRQEQEHDD